MTQKIKNISNHSFFLEHHYGKNIHILNHHYLLSALDKFSSPETKQPELTYLIKKIYQFLFVFLSHFELPISNVKSPTRMHALHDKEGYYKGPGYRKNTKVIVSSLARAGILPSQVIYEELNCILNPDFVKQDHINISRMTDLKQKVTGSQMFTEKTEKKIKNNIIFIPDPMGATGSTLNEVVRFYKKKGPFQKIISIHCMITPEFIQSIQKNSPELIVYSARLDRGFSSKKALKSKPGLFLNEEKGLNKKDYIVPGAGGIGELLNNVYS